MRRYAVPTHVVVTAWKMRTARGLTELTKVVIELNLSGHQGVRVHKVRYLRPSDFETSPN